MITSLVSTIPGKKIPIHQVWGKNLRLANYLGALRSGMGARAATALRRAHLSAPLPRPIPGNRPGLRRAH